jgi:glycosyltransferase involved in cell wall biosynthesis
MKIAVDLLSLGYGGCETIYAELLPRLAASGHDFTVLLVQDRGKELRARLPSSIRQVDVPRRLANPFYRHRYQRKVLPGWLRDNDVDVLFAPGGLTGTRRGPADRFAVVVMMQNMLPFDFRQQATYPLLHYPYMRLRLRLLYWGLRKSFRRADRLICISQYAMEKVLPLVGPADTALVSLGLGEGFRDPAAAEPEVLARHGIRAPYLLYVSILDPYKHQLEVIEGFRRYRAARCAAGLQLVLTGPVRGSYGRAVRREAERLGDAVVCTGPIARAELPPLLRSAEALLFASTCETSSLILMEYLGAGRPIICSRTLPIPEIGGDAVHYVDAEDPQAWCQAFGDVLGNPQLMRDLGERARSRAALFSWDETSRLTLAALTEW